MSKEKTTSLAERQKTLKDFLERKDVQESIRSVASKYLTLDRLLKMILLAASRQPKLYWCSPRSLVKAATDSTDLGLDFTGSRGEGYLVPFRNTKNNELEAQFIPGYRGLIRLALDTGKLTKIEAHVVHERDIFEMELGLNQNLCHKPDLSGDGGKVRLAYAIATPKDGSPLIDWMAKKQIDGIRARSKAKESGPWVSDYEEMARKTVVRRLAKYLDLRSEKLDRALEADDAQFDDTIFNVDMPNEPDEQKKSGVKRVKSKIKDKATEVQQDAPRPAQDEESLEPKQSTEKTPYKCKRCGRKLEIMPKNGKCGYCMGEVEAEFHCRQIK